MEEPTARPVSTLKDLLEWEAPSDMTQCVPLPKGGASGRGPRILVCHDMKGGYIEDRYIQGCGDCDGYRIVDWYLIDTFIYFSHHLVTIPPPGWVDAAHTNNTKILGTFITEWDAGSETCDNFLAAPESARHLADKLVTIMIGCQFDGWLVNIENEVKNVENLVEFVRHLTSRCHDQVPGSQVIWYDSVTADGKLDWQKQLNEKNAAFFDVSDGIFLDYKWNEQKLQCSRDFATDRQVACDDPETESEFGGRRHDVYVGIDVFGRGCPGGGGFNCTEALKLIKQYDLSVAVFAPAWTHETKQSKLCMETERRFWSQFDTFPSARRDVTELPLMTSFCTGGGRHLYHHGQMISESPWYNLSTQQLQPNIVPSDKLTRYHGDGYHGGSSLKVDGIGKFRLFATQIDLDPENDLHLDYVIKPVNGSDGGKLRLRLELRVNGGPRVEAEVKWTETELQNGWIRRTASYKPSPETVLREVQAVVNQSATTEPEYCVLIGYIGISSVIPSLPEIADVTVQRLLPADDTTSRDKPRPFKVTWSTPHPAHHYSLLMQYLTANGKPVTSPSSLTSSIVRYDVVTSQTVINSWVDVEIKPHLLGQTRGQEFVVTKLPCFDGEWDSIKFTLVPHCGKIYQTAIPKMQFM